MLPALELLPALASDVGLARVADRLAALASWGLRLVLLDVEADLAASKIGGYPALVPTADWPLSDGTRSVFVVQIAVSDLPIETLGLPEKLADAVMLSFYVFQEPLTSEIVGGQVVALPAGETLSETRPQLPGEAVLGREHPLALRAELTLPRSWALAGTAGLAPADRASYVHLRRRLEDAQQLEPPRHRLFGHPDCIGDDILEEAALMEAWGSGAGYSAASLQARATSLRLLLRLDSDSRVATSWPSDSTVYFCIPADMLKEARYDHAQALTNAPD